MRLLLIGFQLIFPSVVGNFREMIEDARERRGDAYARRVLLNGLVSLVHEKHSFLRDITMISLAQWATADAFMALTHLSLMASAVVSIVVLIGPQLWFSWFRERHAVGLYAWTVMAIVIVCYSFNGLLQYVLFVTAFILIAFLSLMWMCDKLFKRIMRGIVKEYKMIVEELTSIQNALNRPIDVAQEKAFIKRVNALERRVGRMQIGFSMAHSVGMI